MATRRTQPRRNTLGKVSPPRLGRAFDRERLFARLDACADSPGIWVAGPPGIGKTTLVATYLEARASRCLWLQLDAGDADPATLVHFVHLAAAQAAPRRRLQFPLPTADDLRDVPGLLRRSLRRLAAALDPPWTLVLDNVQELGDASSIHAGLAAALTELPHLARLVVISRNPPPAEFARSLAGQQLGLIEPHALRFTLEETQALVRLHGQTWPAEALQQATDGWPAAMILMLAARGDGAPHAMAQGSARERLFAFFAGEVMAQLGPADAAALMRIAFLPRATAAMARAISGDTRAGRLLAELAQRSLFTDRRDEAEPVYAFHALFGEFLRARAAETLAPDALRALHAQAAELLVAAGHVDAAIAQLQHAAVWDEAWHLIDEHAGRFVAEGRTASLKEWILALPESHRSQPAALYWLGYCELTLDPLSALRKLESAQRGFAAAGDWRGSFCAAAAAADAIVFVGARLDALDPWIAILASHASDYLAQRDPETDLRVLPGWLAAFVHRATDHPLTPQLAELAEGLLEQPLVASQRILLGSLAYYLLWTGQIGRLDRLMVKIDGMCADHDAAPATLLRWYGIGVLVRSLLGRIDEALADARAALAIATGHAPLLAKAHLLMVLAAVAARDAPLARTHLSEAAKLLDPANAIDATTYEFQRGLLALLDGDCGTAARLMRAAMASARTSGWPLREHIALLGQALAATEIGDFDAAEAALRAAFAHRFYAVCRWHHWIAALIEAKLADRRNERSRCLAALRRAFALGRAHGYDFGPLLYCCSDTMSRLAALALEHDIDAPFAVDIVRRHALPAPPNAGERWPWPVRIRTLGRFRLERGDEPQPLARKESRKPLELLKLAIALGGAAVAVDRLAALLWPDAEGDAARNSFDNALHRLRKLLGGDCHVQLRGGALSVDPSTCWTDVAALDACFAQAEALARDRDAGELAAIAERALALYQGAFLAGEDGHPEVLVARNRIQSRFVRAMGAIGARLESGACWEQAALVYRRVAEQEPLAEDNYRRLILCLLQLGQRAEAYAVYRRCRQQLSVVLGIRPAAETEALVAALRE
jgi:ATP/maltotriose-dependent transcriptional regulator MalT/DNA-binding SARP family transcriptional activator